MASIMAGLLVLSVNTEAAQNGFGLQASAYSPSDDQTEQLFDIDSGPIGQVYYRFQKNAHSILGGFGSASTWERNDTMVTSKLDFATLFANYRYIPWHDSAVSLYFGGGFAYLFYDAELQNQTELQTGLVMALEPLVGVEFLANKSVRLYIEAKYSAQIFSTEDFDQFQGFTDIDLSGFYATLGVSFMFGG